MTKIVLVIGYPAAGKTTLVKEFTSQGFDRLNRDEVGGKVNSLLPMVEQRIKAGNSVVLDNTYPTIESREPFIELGKRLKVPVECVWLATSMEDAQLNACLRMMERCDRILMPEDFKKNHGPNLFGPGAIFKYRNDFDGKSKGLKYPGKQTPKVEHGFSKVERREFVRIWGPEYTNRAILLDYDGTLRESTGPKPWPTKPDEVRILPGRAEVLKVWRRKGYKLLGVSNQSAIAKEGLPESNVMDCFERTNELLGMAIDYEYCPHKVPPVSCYCRKPAPGMGVKFIVFYKLKPSECIMVGDATTDKTFAARCGFQFETPDVFFRG